MEKPEAIPQQSREQPVHPMSPPPAAPPKGHRNYMGLLWVGFSILFVILLALIFIVYLLFEHQKEISNNFTTIFIFSSAAVLVMGCIFWIRLSKTHRLLIEKNHDQVLIDKQAQKLENAKKMACEQITNPYVKDLTLSHLVFVSAGANYKSAAYNRAFSKAIKIWDMTQKEIAKQQVRLAEKEIKEKIDGFIGEAIGEIYLKEITTNLLKENNTSGITEENLIEKLQEAIGKLLGEDANTEEVLGSIKTKMESAIAAMVYYRSENILTAMASLKSEGLSGVIKNFLIKYIQNNEMEKKIREEMKEETQIFENHGKDKDKFGEEIKKGLKEFINKIQIKELEEKILQGIDEGAIQILEKEYGIKNKTQTEK